MHALYKTVFALIAASAVFAQTPPQPEFEVASIRPSAEAPDAQVSVGLHIDGQQMRCARLSLKEYLAMAYRTKISQISGPDWLSSQRFDISATLPPGTANQVPEMLKALLAERFEVKLHRDKKELPVYVIEVAKGGVKMKESPPDPERTASEAKGGVNIAGGGSAAGVGVNLGNGSSYTFSNNRFEAKKLTTARFAEQLERYVDRPVVDMTDLKGFYDFAIDVSLEDYRAMLVRAALTAGLTLPPQALRALDGNSLASLSDGLQKLGLRLDSRKAPLDVLVIDQARKMPTDN